MGEYYEDGEIATWRDVFYYFFQNAKEAWFSTLVHFILFMSFSYFFFAGIVLLGASMQILAGCTAVQVIENFGNPVSALMGGVLAAAILQSSTAINILIGSMIVSGLNPQYGVYMMMGANIGTSVTSNIISLFHLRDKNMLERAVAGSSVNSIYYFLTVSILFPLELASGMLWKLAKVVIPSAINVTYKWGGLVDLIIFPVTNRVIIPNTALFQQIASGDTESCKSVYPLSCQDESESFSTCNTGLIACDSDSELCPFFFNSDASFKRDQVNALAPFFASIAVIFVSLFMMVWLINKMLINTPVEVIAKLTTQNNYLVMFLGCGSSFLFSSTSLTECSIMPFVATGILEIEQMFPWCLGSNLGMAVINMLIAWSTGNANFLRVTVANVFFNVLGTLMWYPIPYFREFPLHGALIVGIMTRMWRLVCIVHFAVTFILVPLTFLGLGRLLYSGNKTNVVGWLIFIVIIFVFLTSAYCWFNFYGRERFIAFFEEPDMEPAKANGRDYDEDSYDDDEYTDERSDVSSIGFEEPRPTRTSRVKNSSRTRTFEAVRPKAISPPKGRKRLIKNSGTTDDQNCCCADPNFLGV